MPQRGRHKLSAGEVLAALIASRLGSPWPRTRYRGVLRPFELDDPETGERRSFRVAYIHSSEQQRAGRRIPEVHALVGARPRRAPVEEVEGADRDAAGKRMGVAVDRGADAHAKQPQGRWANICLND